MEYPEEMGFLGIVELQSNQVLANLTIRYAITGEAVSERSQGDPDDCYEGSAATYSICPTVEASFGGYDWTVPYSSLSPGMDAAIRINIENTLDSNKF